MTKEQYSNNRRYDLEERTTKFGKLVIGLCKQLPINAINMKLITQVVGSAGSIGANYREANDALGKKDFALRVRIARKETKETIHWLDLLKESNPVVKEKVDEIISEAIELRNILSAIIKKVN
ncbi:MAG: four helix bundle protein [Patescibacteria group bacterium]